jgi:hypothetical protein
MGHNMVLSSRIMPIEKGCGNKQMYLHRRPFRWPCGRVEAIHVALPDAAWPGLHPKPLDAAIGRYSLHIAPAAARATANKASIKMYSLCWLF